MSNRRLLRPSVLVVLTGLALAAAPQARADEPNHRRIYNALWEMEKARDELRAEKGDLGGHREKAVELLDAAIRQTERALREGRVEVRREPFEEHVYGRYRHHPHAHHVLLAIKDARADLRDARHIPEREREQALRDLERAEHEVEEAVRFLR